MIEELHIENWALIENQTISFKPGLNVLSGETGAGKSILVGALGLLMGQKADAESIRTGAEEARISGTFLISENNEELIAWFKDHDIELDDGAVIVRRTIRKTGRGTIYLQGVPVTRPVLAEFASQMIDMHSQHQHQSLFSVDQHRKLLDRYGNLTEKVNVLTQNFRKLVSLKDELKSLTEARENRELEIESAKRDIEEIESAQLVDGEEEELTKKLDLISRSSELAGAMERFGSLILEGRGGALNSLREAGELLGTISLVGSSANKLGSRFENLFYELEDISETVRELQSEVEFNPEEQFQTEERLALISRLEKKFGHNIEAINRYRDESAKKLENLEHGEERESELSKEISELEKRITEDAKQISVARKTVAQNLQRKVEGSLKNLGMPQASFKVDLDRKVNAEGGRSCGPYGIDSIEFLLSANAGEPLKPLKSVASGGELSRVMLSIKSAFAETDTINILVFDEVDSGIGGEVALSIGRHFRELSQFKQLLSITHLASIASFADNHIKISKEFQGESTRSRAVVIEENERIEEIARMLAGDSQTDASKAHAEELLARNQSTSLI